MPSSLQDRILSILALHDPILRVIVLSLCAEQSLMVDNAAATCPYAIAGDQPICNTFIQQPSWFDMMQLPLGDSLLSEKTFLI